MKKNFTDPTRLFLGASPVVTETTAPEASTPAKSDKKRMQIVVSASVYERLRRKAYDNRESMNEIINRAIERELNE